MYSNFIIKKGNETAPIFYSRNHFPYFIDELLVINNKIYLPESTNILESFELETSSWSGEFRSNSLQNSPFLEGVDFFATTKKDQGSVGRHGTMPLRRDPSIVLPTTTPSTFGRHPFYKKGNLDRSLVLIRENGSVNYLTEEISRGKNRCQKKRCIECPSRSYLRRRSGRCIKIF